MKIYSSSDLYNRQVQEQASEAFLANCIDKDAYKKILSAHVSRLYTPNYFIRMAMGLLTMVAVLFSAGLFALIFYSSKSGGFIALFMIFALICYISLELFVKKKFYYNAGIDNILMVSAITFFICVFYVDDFNNQNIIVSFIMIFASLWMCLRFADAFMAMMAYISLFVFVFLLYSKLGDKAIATAPLVMMALSVIVYFISASLSKNEKLFFYRDCSKAVLILTLLGFYACGNYFVVKELSASMFDLPAESPVPFGWLLWMFTFLIPVGYITFGVMKKDMLFVRTGLGLIAASVFTVRYYYDIMPAEGLMLMAGIVLIAVSYILIKLLRTPKLGFSFEKTERTDKGLLNVEALIIAQTFGKHADTKTGVEFGGGSGGGGGASGGY